MVSFKWRQFKKDVILTLARWYLAYSLSYRDIEELALERGLSVDHSTVNRWVIHYSPHLENEFRKHHKKTVGSSWKADETYIKIKGQWCYLYRAVDKEGQTIEFYLTKKRDKKAALTFFRKAIKTHGLPDKITIDQNGANKAALDVLQLEYCLLSLILKQFFFLEIRQIKYLNNIIEQDRRGIKRMVNPMMGFKNFDAAHATLVGIELHRMLRKNQHKNNVGKAVPEQFFALAA